MARFAKLAMTMLPCMFITPNSVYTGITVFGSDQITEIRWGRRNENAKAHLIAKNTHKEIPSFSSNCFEDIIIEFGKKYGNLCFYIDDDNFDIGSIESHDEEWIKIKTLGNHATLSRGYAVFAKDSIIRIEVDTPYQNNIEELHEADL